MADRPRELEHASGPMRPLSFLVTAAVALMASAAESQNTTVGCGSLAQTTEAIETFAPHFMSTDSVFVNYRQRNGLRALVAGEQPEAVTEDSICRQLGAKVSVQFAASQYWSRAKWTTAYMRLGSYYAVYVDEQYPPDYVGTIWAFLLFDVHTLERVRTQYNCNC